MLTNMPITLTLDRLSAFYQKTENALGESFIRVASGKKVSSPTDGSYDYFHSQSLNNDYSQYDTIRTDIVDVSSMVDVCVKAGQSVFDNLSKMKDMVKQYYDPETTQDEKNVLKADFAELAKQVNFTVDNTVYDDKKLISDSSSSPLRTIYLDNKDLSQTFSVSFTAQQVADASSLTLGASDEATEAAAVDAQYGKAGSYLASASAYSQGLTSQYNINNSKMINSQAAASNITDADEATEIANATTQSIRYQATSAMIAQANAARALILKVLDF